MSQALSPPRRPHKKPSPSPPNPGQPFLSEDVATSTALYKLATTPSPKIPRPSPHNRSQTPSPHDSHSRNGSDDEIDEDEVNEVADGISPLTSRGRQRRRGGTHKKRKGNDDGCVLSKGGYPEIPSGLGLGLAMPVLPSDPEEAYGEQPPLVTWRFSSITKPSSIYSPASPSPSDSIAGDDLPVPSSLSIHTLTPGPVWPPPPSSVVSPVASPFPDDVEPDIDIGDVGVIAPTAEDTSDQRWSNIPATPTSPLPPNIAKLLNEIQSIPRPESQKSPDGGRHVTSVQAWVLDMPSVQQLRGRLRGPVEVRRVKSWRNLRAKMSMPYPPPPPSPPITPPHDASELSQGEEEGTSEGERAVDDTDVTEDDATPVPTQRATFETNDSIHFDTTDFIPYSEMPIPSPANSFEMSRDKPDRGDNEAAGADTYDVDEVQEILPRKVENDLASAPITPDPNSDLVYEIEALLESSPIRNKDDDDDKEEKEASPKPREQNEAGEEESRKAPLGGTYTPSTNEDFFTPAEDLEDRQFFEDTPTPIDSAGSTPTIRQVSGPSTPTVAGSWTPPMSGSTGNTPRRPAVPERRSSLTRPVADNSIDGRMMSSYPPVAGTRPANHRRGKSVDSSSLYNRRNFLERPAQRQRSSSASADNRVRSIGDGPPTIPARRSSIGKTGPSYELLPAVAKFSPPMQPAPLLTALPPQRLSDIRSSSVYSQGTDRWSPIVFGGEQMAEVVSGDLMRSGSVKEVMVRTPSMSTKAKEFRDQPSSGPATAMNNSPQIPSFNFGESLDLNLGKGKERADNAVDNNSNNADSKQLGGPSGGLALPVVFQVIPPTPAAGVNKQLGTQTPQAISIPSTPAPTTEITADSILAQPPTNGTANISKKLDPPPIPHTRTPPPAPLERPRTAPERLNPDDFGSPPTSPRRPSLKKLPTKFRESKLSPWWRPRRDPDSPSSSLSTARTVGSSRPATATTATTIDGSPRRKGKSIKLGKVEVEFVGLKELRRQMKMQKEVKARRRSASLGSGSLGRRNSVGVSV